jgi:hypothetical protein
MTSSPQRPRAADRRPRRSAARTAATLAVVPAAAMQATSIDHENTMASAKNVTTGWRHTGMPLIAVCAVEGHLRHTCRGSFEPTPRDGRLPGSCERVKSSNWTRLATPVGVFVHARATPGTATPGRADHGFHATPGQIWLLKCCSRGPLPTTSGVREYPGTPMSSSSATIRSS